MKAAEETPDIMRSDNTDTVKKVASELKDAITRPRNSFDLSRYQVMEGMQSEDKTPFFTEFIDDDDVLRMNTIEAFVHAAMLPVKKCSDQQKKKIESLLQNMYVEHVKTHKRNMTSKKRQREDAYVRILSNDTGEQLVSSGFQKFFGAGGKKK